MRLYHLLETYKIRIDPTDLAFYQTLGPCFRSLKEAVDIASETKDESISKFSSELEKAMTELMAEVSEIRNKSQDPMVLNIGGKSEVIIKFLEDLRSQLDRVEALKKKYESWNELFKNGGVTNVDEDSLEPASKPIQAATSSSKSGELEETKVEVELKRTLWVSLKEWENITEYVLFLFETSLKVLNLILVHGNLNHLMH
jgi:dynein heavy chain, axonemal